MSVSEKVRNAVKNRCDMACQLFHREPRIGDFEICHIQHQGLGGRPIEADVNQARNLIYACPECHDIIDGRSAGMPCTFLEVDLDHVDDDGNPDPILEMLDDQKRRVPHDHLWLFMHYRRLELASVLDTVRGTLMVEGARASAMTRLYDDFDLIESEAEDPYEMFARQGFDPDHAVRECLAAKWADSHELRWPPGLPLGKMRYFAEAPQKRLWSTCDHEEIQGLLDAAVDMPKAEIRQKLKEMGVKVGQPFFYGIFDPAEIGGDEMPGKLMIARTRDRKKLLEEMAQREGRVVLQINGFSQGWTFKRGENGGLFAADGTEIPYDDLDEGETTLITREEE